ncbi:MAG: YceD family protein [Anaerorhabdus sp.]
MKWTKAQLLQHRDNAIEIDEFVQFQEIDFDREERLRGLKEVHVSGVGQFGHSMGTYEFDLDIAGVMICPCAITNELVEVPFETYSHEIFSFVDTEDIDVHVVKNEIIELLPVIFQLIALEVPLRVVKEGPIDYPKGDGWRILSEAEFEKSKEDQLDPRLAKLKEFKVEKEKK